jgi:hypothetical protein
MAFGGAGYTPLGWVTAHFLWEFQATVAVGRDHVTVSFRKS